MTSVVKRQAGEVGCRKRKAAGGENMIRTSRAGADLSSSLSLRLRPG